MERSEAKIDEMAKKLATGAGLRWDELNDYPGYTKNYWRAEARATFVRINDLGIDNELRAAIARVRDLMAAGGMPGHIAGDFDAILAAAGG